MSCNEQIPTKRQLQQLPALLCNCRRPSGCADHCSCAACSRHPASHARPRRVTHHFLRLRPASAASLAAAITAFFLVALMPRFFVPCAATSGFSCAEQRSFKQQRKARWTRPCHGLNSTSVRASQSRSRWVSQSWLNLPPWCSRWRRPLRSSSAGLHVNMQP